MRSLGKVKFRKFPLTALVVVAVKGELSIVARSSNGVSRPLGSLLSIHTVYCSIVYANISVGFHSQCPQAVFSLPFIYLPHTDML